MRRIAVLSLLAAMAASSACSRSEARASAPTDTLHTAEESLRRFREPLIPVDSLSPMFATREAVARAFVAGLVANDARFVARTLLTRAEFAWLYYPDNPISRPPYELPAGIAWFELEGNSLAGLRHALATYGGRRIFFRRIDCRAEPVIQGSNRLWNGCAVTVSVDGERDVPVRMFGSVLERGGRFKLVTAANDL
jgi:hypothetical protein